jgi:membrane peptidoglycan carboxypeptidase
MSDVHWLSEPFVKTLTDYIPEDAVVKVGPGLDSYIPLNELPPYVGGIAYLSEQILFYEDPAVSLALMTKALGLNLERRRFVYGGSTVTQQLIKNLFLSRDKTLARKVREALISWRVLDIIPRKRILELYLNCIEYAPGVYGIGPAAQFYFQKDARRLTPNEAMFLAMLKPAPHRGVQYMNRGKTPVRQNWWKKRLEQLYDRLVTKGYITQSMVEAERPYILRWDKNGKYLPEKPKRTIHIPLLE